MAPKNVFESQHPALQTKLSQLRSERVTSAAEVRHLVDAVSSILAVEASRSTFALFDGPEDVSAIGHSYTTSTAAPSKYFIVPVLRSGLSMLHAFQKLLPDEDAPVYHLGIFRESSTLVPIEYYNKLPNSKVSFDLAIVVDPIIATGGTARAVIQTLRDCSIKKIIFCALIAYDKGLEEVAAEYPDIDFYVGKIDPSLNEQGYIIPGIGDIGDRLHSTLH